MTEQENQMEVEQVENGQGDYGPEDYGRKIDKHHFSRIGWGFFFYTLLSVGAQLVLVALLQLLQVDIMGRPQLAFLLAFASMYLIAFPIAARYFKTVPRFGEVRNEQWKMRNWLVVLCITMGVGLAGNLLGNLLSNLSQVNSESYDALLDMIIGSDRVMIFFSVVIGAPIVEELLFRKFLIDRTIGYGEKFSVLLSGLLFGLMHGNVQQFCYTLPLGCVLAYIYCKTGKIKNTIFLHMWVNFSSGILLPFIAGPLFELFAQSEHLTELELAGMMMEQPQLLASVLVTLVYVLLQYAAGLLGIIFLFVFKKRISFYPGLRSIPAKRWFGSVILAPGMLLFILLCGFQFFA